MYIWTIGPINEQAVSILFSPNIHRWEMRHCCCHFYHEILCRSVSRSWSTKQPSPEKKWKEGKLLIKIQMFVLGILLIFSKILSDLDISSQGIGEIFGQKRLNSPRFFTTGAKWSGWEKKSKNLCKEKQERFSFSCQDEKYVSLFWSAF